MNVSFQVAAISVSQMVYTFMIRADFFVLEKNAIKTILQHYSKQKPKERFLAREMKCKEQASDKDRKIDSHHKTLMADKGPTKARAVAESYSIQLMISICKTNKSHPSMHTCMHLHRYVFDHSTNWLIESPFCSLFGAAVVLQNVNG